MSDPTTNPATAADFEPYVAEARAEGLSRKAMFLRYFRQARPDGSAKNDLDPSCDTADWLVHGTPFWFYVYDDLHIVVISEDNEWEEVASADHETDESALAWLANQLAERCPVAAMTDEEFFDLPADQRDNRDTMPIRTAEWYERRITLGLCSTNGSRQRTTDKCSQLRRMFGIDEPQADPEVTMADVIAQEEARLRAINASAKSFSEASEKAKREIGMIRPPNPNRIPWPWEGN